MKESLAPKSQKRNLFSPFLKIEGFVKNYAKKCRESYYWMLSL